MIILDTNVISEPLKPTPDPRVMNWLDAQEKLDLFTTVTNLSELKMGVEIMPPGNRRRQLEDRILTFLKTYFGSRILGASPDIADLHAEIFAVARAKGMQILFADNQIAAIAMAHGYTVATRDVEPFKAAGVDVINPWEA